MARTRTLAEIRTQVRRTTAQERTDFVTDAELVVEINQAGAELWDLITKVNPDFYLVRATVTTTAGTEEYTLAAGIAYIRSVSLSVGGQWQDIQAYPQGEANAFEVPFMPPRFGTYTRYLFQRNGQDGAAARLSFRPDPGSNTYRYEYVPAWPDLVSDADEFDGINGWEDYIVQRVAIYVRQKADELEHVPTHAARLDAMRKRIEEMVSSRDLTYAPQISRTRRNRRRNARCW